MAFGAGNGNQPGQPYGMLASEADREAAQAVLKQAFEDERLNQDEFESRLGQAMAARTQGELAQLTRDLPSVPGSTPGSTPRPRRRRRWVLPTGIAAAVLLVAGVVLALVPVTPSSSVGAKGPTTTGSVGPRGAGHCPVGTGATAVAIANALAADPVYVGPASTQLTSAEAGQVRAEIARVDPGRIRIAVVTPATVKAGGGERTLTNAISSCQADAAGTTLLTTNQNSYLVTSYADDTAATQAVESALNTHTTLAGGLLDAVQRLAVVDKASH